MSGGNSQLSQPHSASLPPDPRLKEPAHYDRQEVISAVTAYYERCTTLPHIDPTCIDYPPPEGWPQITRATLEQHGIRRTDEVIELLRHLPYMRAKMHEEFDWIAPECFCCDWRLVEHKEIRRLGHHYLWLRWNGPEPSRWDNPAWVVQLTAGRDDYGSDLMLDTTDGTVTRSVVFDCTLPARTYPDGDPRSWRDECDDATMPVRECFEQYWQKFVSLEWMGMPNCCLSGIAYGWTPSVHHGNVDGEDEGYDPRPQGTWDPTTTAIVAIYQQHGWPYNFRQEECREALIQYKKENPRWY